MSTLRKNDQSITYSTVSAVTHFALDGVIDGLIKMDSRTLLRWCPSNALIDYPKGESPATLEDYRVTRRPIAEGKGREYNAFLEGLEQLLSRYDDSQWEEMPHGVPTLRFLNKYLLLKDPLLPFFEDTIRAILVEHYGA